MSLGTTQCCETDRVRFSWSSGEGVWVTSLQSGPCSTPSLFNAVYARTAYPCPHQKPSSGYTRTSLDLFPPCMTNPSWTRSWGSMLPMRVQLQWIWPSIAPCSPPLLPCAPITATTRTTAPSRCGAACRTLHVNCLVVCCGTPGPFRGLQLLFQMRPVSNLGNCCVRAMAS